MTGMVYCLGEELPELETDDYEWLVYEYNYGSYEGDGEAVKMDENGVLWYLNLGHCSCYGPGENGDWEKVKPENYLDGCVTSSPSQCDAVDEKVRELLLERRGNNYAI